MLLRRLNEIAVMIMFLLLLVFDWDSLWSMKSTILLVLYLPGMWYICNSLIYFMHVLLRSQVQSVEANEKISMDVWEMLLVGGKRKGFILAMSFLILRRFVEWFSFNLKCGVFYQNQQKHPLIFASSYRFLNLFIYLII